MPERRHVPEGAEGPSEELARHLQQRLRKGLPTAVTWLNHYTALASCDSGMSADATDIAGVDGILLRYLLRDVLVLPRTSADTVLPILLPALEDTRIGLVGGTQSAVEAASAQVNTMLGRGSTVTLVRNGYEGRPAVDDLVDAGTVDVLLVGLGAPQQDAFVAECRASGGGPALVMTCGGWFDQVVRQDYYPRWAYPLRLNWLVRLAREPRRLWRRYTLDAIRAIWRRRQLCQWVLDGRSVRAYAEIYAKG